jgi:hypothetical protein
MKRLLDLDSHILGLERFDGQEADIKDEIHARLQARCEVDAGTGCWVYTGCWERSGIAKIRVGTRIYCVPRVAAWLYREGFAIWDVEVVGRSCQTPACFNPDHLLLRADQAEALRRQREGGRLGHHHRHLNWAKVRALRASVQAATPEEAKRLAAGFSAQEGISLRAVRAVLEERTWKP